MSKVGLILHAPCRLHFGLLARGPGNHRQHGGLGLMVREPCLEIKAEPDRRWSVQGPAAARANELVSRIRARLVQAGIEPAPSRITILQAPPEHVGLGSGTQLALGLARLLLELAGHSEADVVFMAGLTGRGKRSGIGLHGFHQGGLIVDGGHGEGTDVPPLLARLPFPDDWSILLVRPDAAPGRHGTSEDQAFAALPPIEPRETDLYCRLVLLNLLPAVIERDLASFGSALTELQKQIGAGYAAGQGGVYGSPRAAEILESLGSLGFVGLGQSSWGPTLYGFSDRPRDEIEAATHELARRHGLESDAIMRTHADNDGAQVRRS